VRGVPGRAVEVEASGTGAGQAEAAVGEEIHRTAIEGEAVEADGVCRLAADGRDRCPASAPMGQNGVIAERRISGSS
jgi:hypothetical protein